MLGKISLATKDRALLDLITVANPRKLILTVSIFFTFFGAFAVSYKPNLIGIFRYLLLVISNAATPLAKFSRLKILRRFLSFYIENQIHTAHFRARFTTHRGVKS
jgi:hypothetical protein